MRGAARAGLAARGVVYTIVALLAVQVAFGDSSERADKEGAFQALARQPAGEVLLVVLAIGLACHALWRLSEGLLNPDGAGRTERAGHLGRAAVYAVACYSAVKVIAGADSAAGQPERSVTARVLDWPLGPWLVGAVGCGLLALAVWNVARAVTGGYRQFLDEQDMEDAERGATKAMAVVGLVSRGIVFALVGLFVLKAAWEHDPDESVGLDGALRRVADAPAGPWLLCLLAAGLLAFGGFSFFQARYRRLLEPT